MVLDGVVDSPDYYKLEKDPIVYLDNTDDALNSFFQFCFEAGPEKCPLFADSPSKIADRLLAVDRSIMEKPVALPGFGMLKAGQWRFSLFNALYTPNRTFPLLAGIVAELEAGAPGQAIQAYIENFATLMTPPEPPLVDSATGLQNSFTSAVRQILCADGPIKEEELGKEQLEAIYNKYRSANELFGGVGSQFEFVCSGMSQ